MSQSPSAEPTIRVLVVDDHDIARLGVRAALTSYPEVQIIDEAANGEQLMELMDHYAGAIDIILMDIDMPGDAGVVITRRLKKRWPGCAVIILSGFTHSSQAAFAAGAKGYVLKSAPRAEIIAAIRGALVGRSFMSQLVQDVLIESINRPLEPLTLREHDVLANLREGLTNAEIAALHNLTENTVKEYVSTILKKLGVSNRTQAVIEALRRGLLT